MPVITIRGTLGSGAPEIGKLVAEKLHIDYVDREIIAEIAERVRRPNYDVAAKEMPPGSLGGRIVEALSYNYPSQSLPDVAFTGAYLPTWEMPLDNIQYLAGLEFVIKRLASGSSIVVRGRGSQFILKDYPGALHILVVAPLALRIKRIMESSAIKETEARKEIEHSDSSHREFARRYFHASLEDPVNYDLVINTEHFSVDDATGLIAGALPFKDKTYIQNKQ
jgi:cytidylate kinase